MGDQLKEKLHRIASSLLSSYTKKRAEISRTQYTWEMPWDLVISWTSGNLENAILIKNAEKAEYRS